MDARARLTDALLRGHAAAEMKPVMDDLLLARFERVEDAAFDVLLEWQRRAEAAGYPRLA